MIISLPPFGVSTYSTGLTALAVTVILPSFSEQFSGEVVIVLIKGTRQSAHSMVATQPDRVIIKSESKTKVKHPLSLVAVISPPLGKSSGDVPQKAPKEGAFVLFPL